MTLQDGHCSGIQLHFKDLNFRFRKEAFSAACLSTLCGGLEAWGECIAEKKTGQSQGFTVLQFVSGHSSERLYLTAWGLQTNRLVTELKSRILEI